MINLSKYIKYLKVPPTIIHFNNNHNFLINYINFNLYKIYSIIKTNQSKSLILPKMYQFK